MISFKQFLLKEEAVDSKLLDLLQNDCEFFLNESNRDGFLLRGMKMSRSTPHTLPNPLPDSVNPNELADEETADQITFWEQETRQDRQPTDTSKKMHEFLNDWFYRTFDIPARSKALFCSGSSQAGRRAISQYGNAYIIFPIGRFEYVWSPKVKDLYMDMTGFQVREFDADKLEEFMEGKEYTDKNLSRAVQSGAEIMVACRKYYAFEYKHREVLEKLLGIK